MLMNRSARLYPPPDNHYHCARCHRQVWICSHCDRGNVYCGVRCSHSARSQSLRRAACKYQSTRGGGLCNAARQRRFRERQRQKVTHQGSQSVQLSASLLNRAGKSKNEAVPARFISTPVIYCRFCGCECEAFLRSGFLRHPIITRS
jgi:hypothetical protein